MSLRQLPIEVTPRPALTVGAKVKFADEKRRWTVRAVTTAGRFAILTQPFNLRGTVLYTVVDFDRGIRGRDNYYGLGYETPEDIEAALHQFQHEEDGRPQCEDDEARGFYCRGSAEVSSRSANHIRLDFEAIDATPTDWAGRTEKQWR